METLHKENLLKLAAFLIEDDRVRDHFNMSQFYRERPSEERRNRGPVFIADKLASPACGTTACAMGWAMFLFDSRLSLYDASVHLFGLFDCTAEWAWCFDGGWAMHSIEQTRQATSARIIDLVANDGEVDDEWFELALAGEEIELEYTL